MNRNLLLTVGLFLVLAGAAVLVVVGPRLVEARERRARTFSFPDTAALVEIRLIEKHVDTVFRQILLRRQKDGSWLIGDTLEVFSQPLQTLLHTLVVQTPRAPVATTAVRNVLKFLKEHRVEVFLRFKDGREEVFYVGGPTPDQRASYMLRPGSDQPYEVFVPGFEGYVTSRYYPDISVWQPNVLFEVRPVDLQAIQLEWVGEPAQSWKLERSQPGAPWRLASGESTDSAQVAEYLLAYTGKFYADEWAPPDSLVGLSPLAEMRLFLWSGKTYHLVVYPHGSSPLHYYVRLFHSPYFTHIIGRHTMDRLLWRREQFLARLG